MRPLVDGASLFTLIWRIFLPLMAPAMVATGLLAFIVAWNEFLFALTFTLTNETPHRAGRHRADERRERLRAALGQRSWRRR